MERKYLKLAVLSAVVFVIVLGVPTFLSPRGVQLPAVKGEYLTIQPFFVEQFLEENPDFKPSGEQAINLLSLEFEEIALSEQGFPSSTLVIDKPISLRISNNSDKVRSFVVLSKAMDGTNYSIKEFIVPAKKKVVVTLLVAPYLNEILASGKVSIEKAEQGIPVFDIACTMNCAEENHLLKVYAQVS